MKPIVIVWIVVTGGALLASSRAAAQEAEVTPPTAQPTEGVQAPQPTEGVQAPQPTERVQAPQRTEGVQAPQRTEGVQAPQPTEGVRGPHVGSAHAQPAPVERGDAHRFERVLAEMSGEVLGVGVAVGTGMLMGMGGGANGLMGGALGGAVLGWWLIAPFTVQIFGGWLGGMGSLAGSVLGHVITGIIGAAITATVLVSSKQLDDTALGALIGIDSALLLAGPVVGYEISDAESRRAASAPTVMPGVAVTATGAVASLTVAM